MLLDDHCSSLLLCVVFFLHRVSHSFVFWPKPFQELGIWLTVSTEPTQSFHMMTQGPERLASYHPTIVHWPQKVTPVPCLEMGKENPLLGGWNPMNIPSRKGLIGTSHYFPLGSIWYFLSGGQNALLLSNVCVFILKHKSEHDLHICRCAWPFSLLTKDRTDLLRTGLSYCGVCRPLLSELAA